MADPFIYSQMPDLGPYCRSMQHAGPLCIRFPGGLKVCATNGLDFGDPSQITRSLFASLNSALAPLAPVFDVIDVLKAVADCVQAIPDLVGPPPDPSGIQQCIPKLLEKLAKLLQMLPPYSIPILVKDICAAVAAYMLGLKLEILAIIAQQQRIIAAATADPGNRDLRAVIDCATGNLDALLGNLNASAGPINRLIGDINAFAEIVGLPPMPSIEDMGSGDMTAALNSIDPMINVLQEIAAAIPG